MGNWIVIGLLIIAILLTTCVECRRNLPFVDMLFAKAKPEEKAEENVNDEYDDDKTKHGADLNINEPLDMFSKADGCREAPATYGLTNTGGNLVLTEKMAHLLTSRGGNATGVPMEL